MANNQNIKIAEEITNEALKVANKELDEITNEKILKIREVYDKLIQAQEEVNKKTNSFSDKYKEALKKDVKSEEYKRFKKNILIPNREKWYFKIMELFLEFQNLVNDFLDQKLQMVFIDINSKGETVIYKIENSISELSFSEVTGRYLTKGKILQNATIFEKNSSDVQASLDETFKEVYKRFNIAKERKNKYLKSIKEKEDDDKKGTGYSYVLWKETDGTWDGAFLNNVGSLGEAYFNFFINNFLIRGNIEKKVKTFIMHKKYGAINADNASGFLQGDVTKNNIEYGIKVLNASALKYEQILQDLPKIMANKDKNLKKAFSKYKKTLNKKASKNMVRYFNGKLDEIDNNLLESITKEIESSNVKIKNNKDRKIKT